MKQEIFVTVVGTGADPRFRSAGPSWARAVLWALTLFSWSSCDSRNSNPSASQRQGQVSPQGGFTDITQQSRIDFWHDSGIDGSYFIAELLGSGGALFDYDNDGDLDLYLVNSGPHNREKQPRKAPNRLYRQESDGTFQDVTPGSGLDDPGYGMGCAIGDLDNDGDLDVYVTNFGPDSLYLNGEGGKFTNITAAAGIRGSQWSSSAAFFDFDRDGFLDLFVATYVNYDSPQVCADEAGRPEYCGPNSFRGVPDLLYRNNRDRTFTDVSTLTHIDRLPNKGLGVVCADFNLDGWMDIYVANDGEKNDLWINEGGKRFEEQALLWGAGFNIMGRPEGSMGIAVGDVEGDLDLDLFVTNMARETNTLYLNLGDSFLDKTQDSGMGPPSLAFTGFGTGFFDADLDGDLDALVVNGKVERGASASAAWLSNQAPPSPEIAAFHREYAETNLYLENDGSGKFRDASAEFPLLCGRAQVGRGALFGDLDRDGDLDIVLTNCNGPTQIFRNDLPRKGHWLIVRAIDPELNRDAIGASVILEANGKSFLRPVQHAYSYLCSMDAAVHFGIGPAERVDRITVHWPDRSKEEFPGVSADQEVKVIKGHGRRK